MAAQTEYVITTPAPDVIAIADGTVSRQWMTPGGVYLDEQVSGAAPGSSRPVVQVSG